MKQRFTLDRESFEQFLAAVSLLQSLQRAAAKKSSKDNGPLLAYLLDTLSSIDAGMLDLQAASRRVAGLARDIVGGDGATLWLFAGEGLLCRATSGTEFDDARIRSSLRSKLQSAGAFGENPPAKLDLTRTFESYSGAVGSSLGIAILPGSGVAGALAVFSDSTRTFTERDYANLRLLAGFAQYGLLKRAPLAEARPPRTTAAGYIPEEHSHAALVTAHEPALWTARSAHSPLLYQEPDPQPAHLLTIGSDTSQMRIVEAGDATGGDYPQAASGIRLPLHSSALEARERVLKLGHRARKAARGILLRVRTVRVNWLVVRQAIPAIAILAVMSFFVGVLTGSRQPMAEGSLNAVAEAAPAPVTAVQEKPKTDAVASPKQPIAFLHTSHLHVTDRETASTIAELSRYEVRTLKRAAEYGDDQSAFELGMLYELGHGFPQDCKKAATWVKKSAQDGNTAAEYNLGLRYRDGDGVDANLQEAESWLRKAAVHKNAEAERALAELASQSSVASLSQDQPAQAGMPTR